ncbi:MAG: type II toxin-antitoxin system ParD family antitoxin [Candidatus Hydrogenedentes bacterium]|nr:type II toxin-antitoxin system ParD family antitoxin [Candidatus Hydrogenedentota bacterium]
MPTQNVNITDAQSEFIRRCVESGDYNNASELVRESLRLLKAQKDAQQANLDWVRAELQKGYDDREAGRYIELNSREDIDAFGREISRRGRERLLKENNASTDSIK